MLFAEKIPPRFQQGAFRHQPHDFGARHAHASCVGLAAHLVESDVQRRYGDVGDVHRNLRDAVLLDKPADGLGRPERTGTHQGITVGIPDHLARDRIALADGAALFAHIEGNGVGTARGGGIEVEIHGDQEIARTDGRGARTGYSVVERTRPEIRRRLLMRQFFGQCLVFPFAADGQIAPPWRKRRGLITIGRDMQFPGDTLGQFAGQLGALFERDARDRDQRQYVRGAHTRMRALMFAHVDQFGSLFHPRERRFDDSFGRADERDNGTVGRLAGIDVQHFDAAGGFDGRYDSVDYCPVAPLAEIRDTFHDTLFHKFTI